MRHFVAVAEELHFGKAARRLNMAQPPLSQSIRRLEADLGLELFSRSRRGVDLTDAGRVFLDEARRTLMQADLARKMAQRAATAVPEIRVSFIGPALYRLLPELIVRYRVASPNVHIRLFECRSPDQGLGLLAGDYDVGFVSSDTEARAQGCETLVVERTPVIAAVPADWPIGKKMSVSLAELAEQPFIAPPSRYRAQSDGGLAIFKKIGVIPSVKQEATQTNTVISLVGAGLGCSLVMATAALTRPPNVRFLPISDRLSVPPWELTMAWHPEHISALGPEFVRFVRDHVAANAHLLDAGSAIVDGARGA
jgi:DNA-binding transcriptional LysR family regulator